MKTAIKCIILKVNCTCLIERAIEHNPDNPPRGFQPRPTPGNRFLASYIWLWFSLCSGIIHATTTTTTTFITYNTSYSERFVHPNLARLIELGGAKIKYLIEIYVYIWSGGYRRKVEVFLARNWTIEATVSYRHLQNSGGVSPWHLRDECNALPTELRKETILGTGQLLGSCVHFSLSFIHDSVAQKIWNWNEHFWLFFFQIKYIWL